MVEFDLVAEAAASLSAMQSQGFDVLPVDDFEEVARLFPQTGRESQTPLMDVRRLDFTQKTAFWLFITHKGIIVGGLGVKLEDLGDEPFDSYVKRTAASHYGDGNPVVQSIARPVCDALFGRLIYIGELQIRSDFQGRLGLLREFSSFVKAISALHWPDFDWMYAHIPDTHLRLAHLYEMALHIPAAIKWQEPAPPRRACSNYLIAINRSQYRHAMASKRRG